MATEQPPQPQAVYLALPSPPPGKDEIDLWELWQTLVKQKKLIAAITAAATAISLAIALLAAPIYRAEVMAAHVTEEKSGALGALAAQYGGLAALAGVNLGGDQGGTGVAIATLKSRALAESFIKEQELLPVLFADRWNEKEKKWRGNDKGEVPTLSDAWEVFQGMLRVTEDRKTGLITLAIEWKDPELVAKWANSLIRRANAELRKEAVDAAAHSIAFLHEQLARTSSVEVHEALYRLIEAQTKNMMIAQTREQYAFKIIDPAVPPGKKVRPKRRMILTLGFVMGVMVAVLAVFGQHVLGKWRSDQRNGIDWRANGGGHRYRVNLDRRRGRPLLQGPERRNGVDRRAGYLYTASEGPPSTGVE